MSRPEPIARAVEVNRAVPYLVPHYGAKAAKGRGPGGFVGTLVDVCEQGERLASLQMARHRPVVCTPTLTRIQYWMAMVASCLSPSALGSHGLPGDHLRVTRRARRSVHSPLLSRQPCNLMVQELTSLLALVWPQHWQPVLRLMA